MGPDDDGKSPTEPNLMFPKVDDDDDNTFLQVFPRTKSNLLTSPYKPTEWEERFDVDPTEKERYMARLANTRSSWRGDNHRNPQQT